MSSGNGCAGGVFVSNFVGAKLQYNEESHNYISWREQMLCLLESQGLLNHINEEVGMEVKDDCNDECWRKKDWVVKGWILGSLSDDLVENCVRFLRGRDNCSLKSSVTARDVWWELEYIFDEDDEPTSVSSSDQTETDYFEQYVEDKSSISKKILDMFQTRKSGAVSPKSTEEQEKDELRGMDSGDAAASSVLGCLGKSGGSASSSCFWAGAGTEKPEKNELKREEKNELKPEEKDALKKEVYGAASKGQWNKAIRALIICEKIFDKTNEQILEEANKKLLPAVVKGVGKEATMFLELLVGMMSEERLRFQDKNGSNALHLAAAEGNITAATILVGENPDLMFARNKKNEFPIHVAAKYANKHVLHFLKSHFMADNHTAHFNDKDLPLLLCYLIDADFYDMALQLVKKYPNIGKMKLKQKDSDSSARQESVNDPGSALPPAPRENDQEIRVDADSPPAPAPAPAPATATARARREDDQETCALERLCERESAFPSGSPLGFWDHLILHSGQTLLHLFGSRDESVQEIMKSEANVHNENAPGELTYDQDSDASAPEKGTVDVENPSYNAPKTGGNLYSLDNSGLGKCKEDTWSVFRIWRGVDILQLMKKKFMNHIREIKTRGLIHEQAKKLLKILCESVESLSEEERDNIYGNCMATAARLGITEVIEMIREIQPKATSLPCKDGHTIYQVAALNRSEKVLNLIFQHKDHKKNRYSFQRDSFGNTLLHLAANLAPSHKLNRVSSAALQMHHELQWFEEMQKLVPKSARNLKNKAGQTARMLFTEKHKGLKQEGERWMKETAESCIIVASLIATVVFAAAITVPGGNNSNTGYPMFKDVEAFIIFSVSDAVSLFTSVTSLIIFLSIMTSRYAEKDFLLALPNRLCIGLITLFISILFMMMAFTSTIHLVFPRKHGWVLITVVLLACAPVLAFVFLQARLLFDLFCSTYFPAFAFSQFRLSRLLFDLVCSTYFRRILRKSSLALRSRLFNLFSPHSP